MKLSYLILGLSLSFASITAQATNVQINPVHIHADSNVKTGAIQISNVDSKAVSFQPTVYRWTQKDGKDVLEPTQDVLASPGLLKLGAGEKKSVRFMRAKMDPSVSEYYKLQLRELPTPGVAPTTQTVSGIQMVILLEQKLPLGFEPKGATPAHLTAQMKDGKLFISNDGQSAWVMNSIGLPGSKPWKDGALGWILPNGGLFYEMPAKSGQTIQVGDGQHTQTLLVQ